MIKDAIYEVNASFLLRSITVYKLTEILKELPANAELLPNRVGNLSVFFNAKEVGFIDVAAEKVELGDGVASSLD